MKIDLIYPPFKDSYLYFLTDGFYEALKKKGFNARILTPNFKDPGSFIDNILKHKPDYTLSFNGILPNEKGLFLSDAVQIQHIAYITDFPIYFTPLAANPRSLLLVPDRDSSLFMKGLKAKRVYTLPLAARQRIVSETVKEYKITAWVSSCLPETILKEIRSLYPEDIVETLKRASQSLLKNAHSSLPQALAHSFTKAPPPGLDFIELLSYLESYTSAHLWYELLKNSSVSIDIFAKPDETDELVDVFKNTHRYHPALSYEEYLNIVQQSEFTLIADPIVKEGGSSLFFESIYLKSTPIINRTPYTETWGGALLYHADNPTFTLESKASDYERVRKFEMWENRVDELLKIL